MLKTTLLYTLEMWIVQYVNDISKNKQTNFPPSNKSTEEGPSASANSCVVLVRLCGVGQADDYDG
jgi:hypothetical protein